LEFRIVTSEFGSGIRILNVEFWKYLIPCRRYGRQARTPKMTSEGQISKNEEQFWNSEL